MLTFAWRLIGDLQRRATYCCKCGKLHHKSAVCSPDPQDTTFMEWVRGRRKAVQACPKVRNRGFEPCSDPNAHPPVPLTTPTTISGLLDLTSEW